VFLPSKRLAFHGAIFLVPAPSTYFELVGQRGGVDLALTAGHYLVEILLVNTFRLCGRNSQSEYGENRQCEPVAFNRLSRRAVLSEFVVNSIRMGPLKHAPYFFWSKPLGWSAIIGYDC
jgi:hypothetical protein